MDFQNLINRYIYRNNGIQQKINRNNLGENKIIINKHTKKIVNQMNNAENIIIEKEKKTEILAYCDVLVVGGGPAGISCAIGSSRAGVNTIIIEKFGCLGGVITTVGMETLGWYRYEGTTDCTGIGIEMEKIAQKMGGTIKWPYNDSQCLDADFFKVVADKLMEDNNIKSILHCYAVDVIIENNIIKGIITESKSGRKAILAKRIIDCTGDADICHLAGCPYTVLDKKERMAVTQVFNCAGIDKDKFLNYTENEKKTYSDWNSESEGWNINEEGESNKEDNLRTPYIQNKNNNISGTWSSISDAGEATNLNLIHLKGYDCLDVNDLTKAEIEGRKKTLEAIKTLKENIPGFEKAKLRNFGMTLGTRDSRKIIGEYNLTKNDVINQGKFYDSIGIFPEFVDGYNILTLPTTGRYFQVPFRCLVPLKIENLLTAGRCVAGDKISHAAMRNMMACTVTGQGAGVASAISLKNNEIVRNVNINDLQRELIKQGVNIDNTSNINNIKSKL